VPRSHIHIPSPRCASFSVAAPPCRDTVAQAQQSFDQIYALSESLILAELALIGPLLIVVGNTALFACPCHTFAIAYTIPLPNPIAIALTLANVTGASKKTNPLTAIGSLLSAPTIEYVVELVTRTHHADVYEMNTEDSPETIMALMMGVR